MGAAFSLLAGMIGVVVATGWEMTQWDWSVYGWGAQVDEARLVLVGYTVVLVGGCYIWPVQIVIGVTIVFADGGCDTMFCAL